MKYFEDQLDKNQEKSKKILRQNCDNGRIREAEVMEVWNKDETLMENLSELFALRKKLGVFPAETSWMADSE